MNKRILISLSVIGAVAAIAVGGTVAYFSDTETSTGNTFMAGTLDLKIGLDEAWKNPWTEPFFKVTDMKPGDQVEKTISLHVLDNDAWLCYKITPTATDDNSCTEPELAAEIKAYGTDKQTCNPTGGGELQNYSNILIWNDDGWINGWQCDGVPKCKADPWEGDNKLQLGTDAGGEGIGYRGPLSVIATGKWIGPGKQRAGARTFTGIKVCLGTIDVRGHTTSREKDDTVITCNGSKVGNIVQSDSYKADITFYAVQQKNNPRFSCPQP